jgi:Imelysin
MSGPRGALINYKFYLAGKGRDSVKQIGSWIRACALAGLLAAVAGPVLVAAQDESTPTSETDLAGLKTYMQEQSAKMKAGTDEVLTFAQQYYDLAKAENFDYQKLWDEHGAEIQPLLEQARDDWSVDAHGNYELNEGMVAGIPSLSYFDALIDAGPSAEDDPAEAVDFKVELPDGTTLDKPGNLFHYLTEPALWGTDDAFVGLRVDMDGDGTIELGEALPEAKVLLGSAQALDNATADLGKAIDEWEPNLSDAFTALVVMIPTMEEYFGQWKNSPFVEGANSTDGEFVANSRLIDVLGILRGLQLTYSKVSPEISQEHPELETQIKSELDGMITFVEDLHEKEDAGTRFTAEQADLYGSELQTRAASLAGQITQAAGLIGVEVTA